MHLESKWAGIVPASGCILDVTTVEIEQGNSVFDILNRVCQKIQDSHGTPQQELYKWYQ